MNTITKDNQLANISKEELENKVKAFWKETYLTIYGTPIDYVSEIHELEIIKKATIKPVIIEPLIEPHKLYLKKDRKARTNCIVPSAFDDLTEERRQELRKMDSAYMNKAHLDTKRTERVIKGLRLF
jgi:hypothetical protein